MSKLEIKTGSNGTEYVVDDKGKVIDIIPAKTRSTTSGTVKQSVLVPSSRKHAGKHIGKRVAVGRNTSYQRIIRHLCKHPGDSNQNIASALKNYNITTINKNVRTLIKLKIISSGNVVDRQLARQHAKNFRSIAKTSKLSPEIIDPTDRLSTALKGLNVNNDITNRRAVSGAAKGYIRSWIETRKPKSPSKTTP